MLFDLRGKGRRRAIKVIYSSLALLLGGGLVLFGIGSDTQGGLFDAFNEDGGSSSQAGKDLERTIERAERRVLAAPRDPRGWATLTQQRLRLANLEGYQGSANALGRQVSVFDEESRPLLRRTDQSWTRYLALEPPTPNVQIAGQMVQIYDAGGLSQFAKAVTAQEIVVEGRETETNEQKANLFATLALLAYSAEQDRKGDLAAKRAVDLAPERDRKELREQLTELKTQISAAAAAEGSTTVPSG